MSHHSSQPPSESFLKLMKDIGVKETELERRLKEKPEPGPTGQHPDGYLVPEDDGELAFQLANVDGKVVMIFNTPVQWVGFTPEQARDLADGLVKLADSAGEKGE